MTIGTNVGSHANTVVIILPTLTRGGMERDAVRMTRGFVSLGYRVTVVSLKQPYTLQSEFESAGGSVLRAGQRRGRDLRPLLRLAGSTDLKRARIVIGYGFHATVVAPLLAAFWRAGCCLVGYGGNPERPTQTWLASRMLSPLVGYWLVNSRALADRVAKLGARKDDVVVLNNELDPPDPEEVVCPRDPYLLGIAARLERIKRHDVLIRALGQARNRSGLDLRLRVVGDGSCRGDLESLVTELGLEAAVEFRGEHPRAWREMTEVGLACLSSDSESTPNFLLEAMKRGVPVIATNVGGVSEFIVNNETGRLVDPGDIDGYSDAILDTVNDPATAQAMAVRAASVVGERFGASRAVSILQLVEGEC